MNNTALRDKLKLRHLKAQQGFAQKHPHAKSFFDDKGFDLAKVREHSAKLLTAGALSGTLLLSPPDSAANQLVLPEPIAHVLSIAERSTIEDPQAWLTANLQKLLPPRQLAGWALPLLTLDEEKVLARVVQKAAGVPARASLEGEHLNTTYGYIGAEQHLPRFPGDTIALHDEFRESGITPARGAWGYFAPSRSQMTQEDIMREKYYVAVQTLYLPDWNKRWQYLKDWYKWRKVIVVDAENGNAVVTVVGDAGPASWTGKHFGGSPEVMNALGGPRYKKGRVLLFFVDDPENKVPLGVVKLL